MPIIKKQQTLIDFAVQYSGSQENIFAVAQANGKNLTDDMVPGSLLVIPAVTDVRVAKFYSSQKYDITTNLTQSAQSISDSGIGYWAIEDDNIVQ